MAFKGFTVDTFATYSKEKWASNVHNLARMKVKDSLVALTDEAIALLDGGELDDLTRATSDEIPNIMNHKKVDAQWAYWFRGPEERKRLTSFLSKTPLDQATIFNIAAQDKHAILAIVLRETELWVGLRVAPGATVDQRNLAQKLKKSWERERFLELLTESPEGVLCGLETNLLPAEDYTLEKLEQMVAALDDATNDAWEIGHRIPASDAVELGTDLSDYVGRWLGALAPFYHFVAWSRDNDSIEATKKLQEEKAQKRRQAVSYQKGDKVRIVGGLFSGKMGFVESTDAKSQVKVRVGKMSVILPGQDVHPVKN